MQKLEVYFEGIKRDYKKNIIANMLINKINELDYDVMTDLVVKNIINLLK